MLTSAVGLAVEPITRHEGAIQRPLPPDFAALAEEVNGSLFGRTSSDVTSVLNAAIDGMRTAEETATIISSASDVLWSEAWTTQRDVIVAALQSPWDAQGIAELIDSTYSDIGSGSAGRRLGSIHEVLATRWQPSGTWNIERPLPPDIAGLTSMVDSLLWKHSADSRSTVITAAREGARSVTETRTIVEGVGSAMRMYTPAQQIDVTRQALRSPWDAIGVVDAVEGTLKVMWKQPVNERLDAVGRMLGGYQPNGPGDR